MRTYEIPRNYKGEGRILYIFSTKALIYTVGGILIGVVFKWLIGLIGKAVPSAASVVNVIGIALIVIFALVGFALGTFKVPQIDKFEITRKAGGISLDTVVKEYIKFHINKNRYYTYDTSDLIKEEIERKEKEDKKAEEEKLRKEKK